MYKILIRPLEKEDAQSSWKWRNDKEVWKYTGSSPDLNITPDIEINWIEKVLKDSTSKRFAITVDDEYIGNIQLTNITPTDAEFHIFIGNKNFWGNGISYSATQQIIRYAKNFLKLKHIYLFVKPENQAAIMLYEKAGFKKVSEEIKMLLKLDEMIKPTVSIFCMVYNHEQYIKQCIEKILMQKCLFDFEIVIGEDCSTDNSRALILELVNKYPGKFKLLFHNKNIGAQENQNLILKDCIGKYVALCEGDDYWIDPYKLQKQVDFLELNNEYTICHHRINLNINEKEELHKYHINKTTPTTQTLEDITNYNFIYTCSVVFRNIPLNLPDWSKYLPIGDYTMWLYLAKFGKIYYMPDIMAVYRIGAGVFSSENSISKLQTTNIALHFYKKIFERDSIYYKNLEKQEKENIRTISKYYLYNTVHKENNIKDFISFNTIFKLLILKLTVRR